MDGEQKDIELLISRHLDGELSEDEELELNRRLIRHPEARRLLEACQRVDSLAAAALDRTVPDRAGSFDPAKLIAERRPARKARDYRGWLLVPGAIAAALLAVVVNQATLRDGSDPRVAGNGQVHSVPAAGVRPKWEGHDDMMRHAVSEPVPRRQIKRDTARDVYGILGEDGRIYWIEVDRTRTLNRPNAESKHRSVSEVL